MCIMQIARAVHSEFNKCGGWPSAAIVRIITKEVVNGILMKN